MGTYEASKVTLESIRQRLIEVEQIHQRGKKVAISDVLIAVLLGLLIRNAAGVSASCEAGIKFALEHVLRLGIILLGLRLSLQDVAATGGAAMLLVFTCIAVALLTAYLIGRLFKIPPRLTTLIGVGTSICGNTAIVATGPAIGADDDRFGGVQKRRDEKDVKDQMENGKTKLESQRVVHNCPFHSLRPF